MIESGIEDVDHWMAGHCGQFAVAFVEMVPGSKIVVEWGTGHDSDRVSHAMAQAPNGRYFDGEGSHDFPPLPLWGGPVERDVDPERVAESMRFEYSADEPWVDNDVHDAANEISDWMGRAPELFDNSKTASSGLDDDMWLESEYKYNGASFWLDTDDGPAAWVDVIFYEESPSEGEYWDDDGVPVVAFSGDLDEVLFATVANLRVDPLHQRKGMATKIMEMVEEALLADGIDLYHGDFTAKGMKWWNQFSRGRSLTENDYLQEWFKLTKRTK